MRTLQMSVTPYEDILRVSNPVNPVVAEFKSGYEYALNCMPDFTSSDTPPTPGLIEFAAMNMQRLSIDLMQSGWTYEDVQSIPANTLKRVIIGIERTKTDGKGSEIVVGFWGRGFHAATHGHGTGYLHDILLHGKLLSSTYRFIEPESAVARIVESKIIRAGETMLEPQYTSPNNDPKDRSHGLHSFTVLENAASLHFVPEHPRDGRDNTFDVEYFEDVHHLQPTDVTYVRPDELQTLPLGSVVLIRNVFGSDFGDHYTVITGKPVMDRWRVAELTGLKIEAKHVSLFNFFEGESMVVLRLSKDAEKRFLQFQGIAIANGKIYLPDEN